MSTIRFTETDTPSRSKGRGWAYIERNGERIFAKPNGVETDVKPGETITLVMGVELRRASRTTKDREVHQLIVTGEESDSWTLRIGSPQSYVVQIDGADLVEG